MIKRMVASSLLEFMIEETPLPAKRVAIRKRLFDEVWLKNCGTGAGGFSAGNTCARGGGAVGVISGQVAASLTEDETAAVSAWWTGQSDDINAALRSGGSHELVAPLDSAIKKSDGLTQDTVLYRGISVAADDPLVGNLKKGFCFSDKGYVAMTSDHSIATRFATGGVLENRSYIVAIKVPKGTKSLDVPSGIGEKLFARNTGFFKVDEIKKRRGEEVWDVSARFIDLSARD